LPFVCLKPKALSSTVAFGLWPREAPELQMRIQMQGQHRSQPKRYFDIGNVKSLDSNWAVKGFLVLSYWLPLAGQPPIELSRGARGPMLHEPLDGPHRLRPPPPPAPAGPHHPDNFSTGDPPDPAPGGSLREKRVAADRARGKSAKTPPPLSNRLGGRPPAPAGLPPKSLGNGSTPTTNPIPPRQAMGGGERKVAG